MTIRSLHQFSKDLRNLPRRVGNLVAAEAAPAITDVGRKSFLAGEDAYGVPWVPKLDGKKATLRQTDDLFDFLFYVAIGTKLRVALGTKYAKYQIGRRPIFPTQGGALPPAYVDALSRVSSDVCRREIGPR